MSSTRPTPARATTWAQVLTALLALILFIGVVTQLKRTAPSVELDLSVPLAELDDVAPTGDEPGCRRRGPEASERVLRQSLGRVTSGHVVACPALYDGRTVSYVGEVIGDVLQRDGGAWVLMNDDPYALGVGPLPSHQDHGGGNSGLAVWLPTEAVPLIDGVGGPDARGTVLEVRGRVFRSDPADGGGLTLRADEVSLLADAVALPHPLHTSQIVVAMIAALAAVGLVVAERRVARTR